MTDLWASLAGLVEVELTSAGPPGTISFLTSHGVHVQDATLTGDLTLCFRISRREFRKLAQLADRRGERLRILRRKGIYWTCKGLLKRPVLLGLAACMLAFSLYLPGRVLLVRVEGNQSVPSRQILEAAEDCGIRFWTARRGIRSEQVKNKLLGVIPQLQWVGINTAGCVATISVRERSLIDTPAEAPGVCNVVASREGVITEVTVLQGNPLCKIGQAVQAGELLVSGYTDCGLSIQATRAKAEIYAMTNRELSALLPADWTRKGDVTGKEKKYSLLIGKKRIKFGKNSGILTGTCGKMTEIHHLTLPGGFVLPLGWAVETITYYQPQEFSISPEEAQAELCRFSTDYLTKTMVAGEIMDHQEQLESLENAYQMTGEYACQEMIARQQNGEIFKTNGKAD